MRKGDFVWLVALLGIVLFLVIPQTNEIFITMSRVHPFIMGFTKLAIMATMGDLLAFRILNNKWLKPTGLLYRVIIWGFIGIVLVIIFDLYSNGITALMLKGILPGSNSKIAFALITSTFMNVTFAPSMMGFHRITDTYIDLKYEYNVSKVDFKKVIDKVDWNNFISFIVFKTIPFFWIPAHTITFLLPSEYRVLMAAFLSIALGIILSFGKMNSVNRD